jgi:chromosome partitioning protein
MEVEYFRWLMENPENNCFAGVVPRAQSLQYAARFRTETRSYFAKYPGQVGMAIRALTDELVERLAAQQSIAKIQSAGVN